MKHVDFLVHKIAQPIADFMHNKFGITCYRLAAQMPLLAGIAFVAHTVTEHENITKPFMLLLRIVMMLFCVWESYRFYVMDKEAQKNDYIVKPASASSASTSVVIWKAFAIINIVTPPHTLDEILLVFFDICFICSYLLIMCDVKPRKRQEKRVLSSNSI